jgi:hypothetical protein
MPPLVPPAPKSTVTQPPGNPEIYRCGGPANQCDDRFLRHRTSSKTARGRGRVALAKRSWRRGHGGRRKVDETTSMWFTGGGAKARQTRSKRVWTPLIQTRHSAWVEEGHIAWVIGGGRRYGGEQHRTRTSLLALRYVSVSSGLFGVVPTIGWGLKMMRTELLLLITANLMLVCWRHNKFGKFHVEGCSAHRRWRSSQMCRSCTSSRICLRCCRLICSCEEFLPLFILLAQFIGAFGCAYWTPHDGHV